MDSPTQTLLVPRRYTLSPVGVMALATVAAQGPLRFDELAAAGDIGLPALAKALRTLVDDELVFRIADVDDARAWLIALTPKGAEALQEQRADEA